MREEKSQFVGALWKPRQGANHKGKVEMTVNGWKQTAYIYVNENKTEERQPDYKLRAFLTEGENPIRDTYVPKQKTPETSRREEPDDDIPF